MVIADKNEQVDNHTFIDHKVADCTSNEPVSYTHLDVYKRQMLYLWKSSAQIKI